MATNANGIEVATYDPRKVNLILNGKVITGFTSDGVVTITRNEDIVSTNVGVKGDVAYSENANESGNIAFTLMESSSSLPYVRELALKRRPVQVTITDANDVGAVQVAEEDCRVLKPADATRGKEVGGEQVNIFVPFLNFR